MNATTLIAFYQEIRPTARLFLTKNIEAGNQVTSGAFSSIFYDEFIAKLLDVI